LVFCFFLHRTPDDVGPPEPPLLPLRTPSLGCRVLLPSSSRWAHLLQNPRSQLVQRLYVAPPAVRESLFLGGLMRWPDRWSVVFSFFQVLVSAPVPSVTRFGARTPSRVTPSFLLAWAVTHSNKALILPPPPRSFFTDLAALIQQHPHTGVFSPLYDPGRSPSIYTDGRWS